VTNVDRRLAKVEEALDPAGIIVRWLAEAHACGDMSAYVRARPDDPMPPLDALVRQAKQAATGRARGRPRDEADATLRNAVVGTVFRFKLVLRMNVVTSDLPDREVLIHAALAMAGVMAMEGLSERRGLMSLATCRDRLLARVTELLCHDAARANVEKKYLRGMPTLFPATQRQSDDQVRQSQTVVGRPTIRRQSNVGWPRSSRTSPSQPGQTPITRSAMVAARTPSGGAGCMRLQPRAR
jgi:hypothetical protein